MTTKISKVSQRANQGDRKVVFKSALEDPHRVSWPAVPLNIQNMVLASLLTILEGVGEYNLLKQTAHRKLKRAKHDKERKEKARAKKRQKRDSNNNNSTNLTSTIEDSPDQTMGDDLNIGAIENVPVLSAEVALPPEPPILSHLTYGINEVTKLLEKQAESRRCRESLSTSKGSERSKESFPEVLKARLSHVFVCRPDIDPPLLIAHLPELAASCNVPIPRNPLTPVYLVPLPKGSESALAAALAVKRVSIIALDVDTPQLDTITSLLTVVQPPSAPWLTPRIPLHSGPSSTQLVPTHIKQLRTTAPRDMRKAKEDRAKGRQAAREKKNEVKTSKARMKDAKVKRKLKIVSVSQDLLPT